MVENTSNSAVNEDDPTGWREVFQSSESGLRAFLRGRLNQEADVDDCLQVVFMKMIESGADVAAGARRAWLFRVAANEAAKLWRQRSTTTRVLEKKATNLDETTTEDATDKAILDETTDKLRQAIAELPKETQQIIRMRVHDNKKFQEIADELGIPLGTALTKMRRALERLKQELDQAET